MAGATVVVVLRHTWLAANWPDFAYSNTRRWAGVGTGIIENARIRVRRLSVLWRDYAACADSIPRGITAGDIRM